MGMNARHSCKWEIIETGEIEAGNYRIERCDHCGRERAFVNDQKCTVKHVHKSPQAWQ